MRLLVHNLADHVHALHKERLHPVLLLDEAHLLPQETLDVLPRLLNYDWDSLPLLSLVLRGEVDEGNGGRFDPAR